MTTSGRWIILVAALLAAPPFFGVAEAQDVRREPVHFAAGKTGTSIKGAIRGEESVEYVLGAAAGQRMVVKLSSSNTSANFNILPPEAGPALFNGSVQGDEFSGTLATSGNYTVQVYLMRNAARRGEKASYKLDVKILGAAPQVAEPAPEPEAEYFEVTGVSNDDPLNLRAGPSTNDRILATFGPGVIVHNLGCSAVGSGRWCEVELARDLSVTGWVSAKFLTETSAPETEPQTAKPPADDAVVPAAAAGKVPCSVGKDSFDLDCAAGAIPDAEGAVISLTRPDSGTRRVLMFNARDQAFSTPDGADLAWLRQGSSWWVSANGTEFYLIPEALIAGK